MPSYSSNVKGVAAFVQSIEARVARTEDRVKRTVGKHTLKVHADAVKRAPRGKTSNVVQRLGQEFDAENIRGIVKEDSEHGPFAEFGTGRRGASDPPANNETPKGELPAGMSYDPDWPGMAARPFLVPAVEADRAPFNADVREDLQRGMGGR